MLIYFIFAFTLTNDKLKNKSNEKKIYAFIKGHINLEKNEYTGFVHDERFISVLLIHNFV